MDFREPGVSKPRTPGKEEQLGWEETRKNDLANGYPDLFTTDQKEENTRRLGGNLEKDGRAGRR